MRGMRGIDAGGSIILVTTRWAFDIVCDRFPGPSARSSLRPGLACFSPLGNQKCRNSSPRAIPAARRLSCRGAQPERDARRPGGGCGVPSG
jgi:hypothetical protein